MDAQKLGSGTRSEGSGVRLSFEAGEESLKPLEARSVLADPDEFYSSQSSGWVRRSAQVPDVLKNTGPRGNTNTSTDENSDLVFEDIFSWCSVGTINADFGHNLSVL